MPKKKIRQDTRTRLWKLPNGYVKRGDSATLLELFYDLVIVAALGGITHALIGVFEGHTTVTDKSHIVYNIAFNSLQTLAILLLWKISTLLSARFNLMNQRNRLFVLIQMIGFSFIIAGVYSSHDVVNDITKPPFMIMGAGYAIVIISMLLHVTSLYIAADDKYIKKQLLIEIIGRIVNIFVSIIWYVSLTLGRKYVSLEFGWNISLFAWALNIAVFILFSWFANSNRLETNTPDLRLELIQERYSILYIVFLGETLVQIITASADVMSHDPIRGSMFLVGGVISTYILWWIFNDLFNLPDIVERPETIHQFQTSMIFLMTAFVYINVGYSLFIKGDHNEVAGYMMVSGAVLWNTLSGPAISSMKGYNRERRAIIPIWARRILQWAPVHVWTYAWAGIVFPQYYIYVMFAVLTAYAIFMYTLAVVITKKSVDERFEFDKAVEEYKQRDQKWIDTRVVKFIDDEHHSKYDFKLNRYSQHSKKST